MAKNKSKRSSKDLKTEKNLDAKLSQELGEINRIGNETIIRRNVGDADLDYSRVFGANKNLYRTTASMIDGLKPGARRLIYSWWLLENKPENVNRETINKLKFYKVVKLSSNTTADYHPHGDVAIQDLIGKMGQYWSNNVQLIVPQGSYGNLRGDQPASGRYRECKLAEYTIDCFFDDYSSYCITTKDNYLGTTEEPEYLPAKYPHVLFNPQFSGIGYGLASNIPPFNVNEVLDATIKLIKDPDSKILLIPDSPTGCDIIDEGQFKKMNKTGQSKFSMRATSEIDFVNNIIHFNTLPYNGSSQDIITKIINLREKDKVFKDIIEIRDNTIEGKVSLDLYLSKDAKPEKVLDHLYKKNTGLKSSFPVGIILIDDYTEYEYGIKDLLLSWIDYRIDVVRSMFLNKLQIIASKKHMNDVLLMVFAKTNIDKTIKISKTSKSRKETIERLMLEFDITSLQAATIADMRVYNFNEDSYNSYKENDKKLKEEMKEVEEILLDDEKIEEFIIGQLKEGKKKYGHPRLSKIVKENDDSYDDIPNTEHLVGITETGYIKKLLLKDNINIGPIGKTSSAITVLDVNNRENILVIDSEGNVVKVSLSAIPDMKYEEIGIELKKFFSVKGSIRAVMELPSMEVLKVKDDSMGIIFITKNGLAKKVQISEFKKITDTKPGITLNSGDEVRSAIFAFNNTAKDIILGTNFGDGIRLPLSEIRNASASAKGVNMISLKEGEEIVGSSLVNPNKKYLFYITSSGRCKLTEMKYLPVAKRKGESLSLIKLVGNETLVACVAVNKSDKVIIYKKNTEQEEIDIKDMPISTRAAQGEKLVKTGRGDCVVGYKVFSLK